MTMRHIGEIARSAAETVALAAIRRAEQDGDTAKADRLRRIWENHERDGKREGP